MSPTNPQAQPRRSIREDRDVTFLAADLQIGLRFAHAAIAAADPRLVAVNRANAEEVHDGVRRQIDRRRMSTADRAFLLPRLEELRVAIQTACAWQRCGQFGHGSRPH